MLNLRRWLAYKVWDRNLRVTRRKARRGPARSSQYLAWIRTLPCCACGQSSRHRERAHRRPWLGPESVRLPSHSAVCRVPPHLPPDWPRSLGASLAGRRGLYRRRAEHRVVGREGNGMTRTATRTHSDPQPLGCHTS